VVAKHDRQINVLFENVQKLLTPAPVKRKPIGFVPQKIELVRWRSARRRVIRREVIARSGAIGAADKFVD
jgi:hypothetical protein